MKLEKNARICNGLFVLWAIPYTLYYYYLSLYLMEFGFTEIQVGSLMTVTNVSALVCSFFTSPVTDRLGRKNTVLVFDLLSSVLPPLLLLVRPNLVFAVLAMVFSGFNRIMSASFYLLMIEDTSEENSMNAMNWFNIIMVAAGLLTPVASAVVAKLDVVRGEKLFLLAAVVAMTVNVFVRHALVDETPTGIQVRKNHGKFSFSSVFGEYGQTVKYIRDSREVRSALVVNVLIYSYYTVGTTISLFFTPYFAQFRNLGDSLVGTVGAVYAVCTLFAMLFINSRIKPQNIYGQTMLWSVVSLAGFALMILCPQGNTVLMFVSIVLIALSYGVLKSVADGLLAMKIDGPHGAGVYSVSFVVSSVVSVLAIQILQRLYSDNPQWLFGTSAVLVALVLVQCLVFRRRK